MRMYVSWLDGNPDKIEVIGSSPILRTLSETVRIS